MKTLNERLREHRFLKGMPLPHVQIASCGATFRHFTPGLMLMHEGEPAESLYLIETGRIALQAHEPGNGTIEIEQLGSGDVLGWSWLFPPFVWHFQAEILVPTEVIRLNGAHLLVMAERNKEFGYELMKRVSHILIHRLEATRKRLFLESCKSKTDSAARELAHA